uniref:Uncharacterized protein n=1 Tax=Trichobilharzia regenti TaxID=157069 RepID=A0AA85JGU5_TRIRE|nr:unnamed protein product [Trichobilharzia regenti]
MSAYFSRIIAGTLSGQRDWVSFKDLRHMRISFVLKPEKSLFAPVAFEIITSAGQHMKDLLRVPTSTKEVSLFICLPSVIS